MADNTITLTLGVDDKGTAILRSFQKTTEQTFQKIKGDSGSLVDSVKKHWLGLTAAATATGLAINRAWGLAEMAAQFQEQKASLNALASQYGTSANKIISSIQTISQGLISMSDAVTIAGSAMVKGLSPDQIINLAGAAETLSNITGQKVSDAFRSMADSIALGRSRGIEAAVGMIDLKDKYGDLVDKMSEAEKAQKMYAIVMERVTGLQKTLGEGTDSTADKMERLTVQIADLKLEAGAFVIKGGLALFGILQGTAAAALFLASGIFGIIAALGALSDKLGLTSGGFAKWRAEADAALAASEELAKKGKDNLAAIFAAPEDLAGAAGGVKPPSGGGGGGKDALATERLSFIKSLNSEILQAEKQHQEAWLALAIEYNAKEVEAKKLGKGAVLKVEEWYSAQASALLRKDGEDAAQEEEARRGKAIDELGQQNNAIASFYEKLAADTLSAQTELYGEYWALAVEYSAKEAELHAMGIDDKLALEEWYFTEVERLSKKETKDLVKDSKKEWTEGMQDFQAALSAISSGSLSQIAGLFGPYGMMVGGAIEFISHIGELPGKLKESIQALVRGAAQFGEALVTIIEDIIMDLPAIALKIINSLLEAIPKIFASLFDNFPDFVRRLALAFTSAAGLFIKAIIKGLPDFIAGLVNGVVGAVFSLVNVLLDTLFGWIPGVSFGNTELSDPAWADENTQAMEDLTDSIDNLNDSINKQLTDLLTGSDSPASAIDRLQVAWEEVSKAKGVFAGATGEAKVEAGSTLQDALSTYLDVAQEAYQRPSDEYQAIFDTTVADLKAIQTGLAGISTTTGTDTTSDKSAWAGWEGPDIWGGITNAVGKIFSDAWEGLKKIFSDFWEAIKTWPAAIGKIFSDLWDTIISAFDSYIVFWTELPGKLGKIFSDAWASLTNIFKFSWPSFPSFSWPTFSWPSFPSFSWPTFSWPSLPTLNIASWNWPSLPTLSIDLFHDGGVIQKAHSGKYITGTPLAPNEIPIIALAGEGVLNNYNGMQAVGGEAGLNYINQTGELPKFHSGGAPKLRVDGTATTGGSYGGYVDPSAAATGGGLSSGLASSGDPSAFQVPSNWPDWMSVFDGLLEWIKNKVLNGMLANIQAAGDWLNSTFGITSVESTIGGWAQSAFGGLASDLERSDLNPDNWFHDGGMIRAGGNLASYEVPIIAKVGEGVLNDYNGMKAIGGEAGLNYANKTGRMIGGGSVVNNYSVSPQVTINTKGEVDTESLVRKIVQATTDSLKYGKMRQIVMA